MSHLVPGCWIALARMSGRVDIREVLRRLGGRAGLEGADIHGLVSAGLTPRMARQVLGTSPLESEHDWCVVDDEKYPRALMDLPFPPPVLWWWGNLDRLDSPGLSIVGARQCTQTGQDLAYALAQETVGAGGVVVSGAARGIDTAAHQGAEGRTIAVLGCPIEHKHSSTASRLYERLLDEGGLVLSEVPPNTGVQPRFFPRRNRIIAALGLGCVVVEANRRSGSLITARLANELGREVAAVPGPIHQPMVAGCLRLIAEGARCLCSVAEVVELLGDHRVATAQGEETPRPLEEALRYSSTVTELSKATGVDAVSLTRTLALWEIAGRVRREASGRWRLISSGVESSA